MGNRPPASQIPVQKPQFSNLFFKLVVLKQSDSEKTTFLCACGGGRGGAGTLNALVGKANL